MMQSRGGSEPKFSKPSRARAQTLRARVELEPEFFKVFQALAIKAKI